MAPPSPTPRATFTRRQTSNTSPHLLKSQQQQQVGLMKPSQSIVSTIQQIKVDFDRRRSVNAENKLKLSDLKSQTIYLKSVATQLSSQTMSINAGVAFRERKEVIPTREDVDELGLYFERLNKQTKHLIERLKTVKTYTVKFVASGDTLKRFIESILADYHDVQSKTLLMEQKCAETMTSYQTLSKNLLQTTADHDELMHGVHNKETNAKQREEVVIDFDQEIQKLKNSIGANYDEFQCLESEKKISDNAKRNTLIAAQKGTQAITLALKAIYNKNQSLESEIEDQMQELDCIKSKICKFQRENNETIGSLSRCVDLLDNLCEYVRQEESNLFEIENQVSSLKEEVGSTSDTLRIKIDELDSYKNALSDMENVLSRRQENLKIADAELVSLKKEVPISTDKVPKDLNFQSNRESVEEDIMSLADALQISTKDAQSAHDLLKVSRESLQNNRDKESELKVLFDKSNSFLFDINNRYNLQRTLEKSNEELALSIQESQQTLINERNHFTHLRSNNSGVNSNMTRLKQHHDTTIAIPNQNDFNALKGEISILQSQIKDLQSGHSKFATLDENRDQEIFELQKALQQEEKFDTGPRRRQHLKERQQELNQKQKTRSLSINSSHDPFIDNTPEDSDSNDFFFRTDPDITNPVVVSSSNSKDDLQMKTTTMPFVTKTKTQMMPHTDKKKKQSTVLSNTDSNIISLEHASASIVLRRKPIKKNRKFGDKHWLENKDW